VEVVFGSVAFVQHPIHGFRDLVGRMSSEVFPESVAEQLTARLPNASGIPLGALEQIVR
jgi:hypothetical protein